MTNTTFINNKIRKEMNAWSRAEYAYIVDHLARMCTCSTKYISCIPIYPGDKPGYDCGFVFFGPSINKKEIMLGEIRWDRNGECTDFIAYEDNIAYVHDYLARRRLERARAKSVNRTKEQAREREITVSEQFLKFVGSFSKEIAASLALLVVLGASYVAMGNALNPSYINESYDAGYQAVNYETHRTNDKEGYWYDYGDIAARYNEDYDFDSWVYGTYKNVGWNTQSKLECMDDLFRHLELRGVTEYDSFLEYCDAKGVCVEKNGKLVIDTGKFSKVIEEYMNDLNSGEKEVDDTLSNESSGLRI